MTDRENSPKRTPLYAAHRKLGARLVDFAGWEMPVEYTGIVEEHQTVRRAVGLFDVSHMGELFIEDRGALELIQKLTPNDAARLAVGQAQYSALTNPRGCFVDDLLVYRLGEDRYLTVVNASNIAKDLEWVQSHNETGAVVRNASEDFALLSIQGPRAQEVLSPLTDLELGKIRYYRFADGVVAGKKAMVSRTGYTGEDGFELMVDASSAESLWWTLIEKGAPQGLKPVGLGARDTLRLEAKMALYGNDIDESHSVLEADLGWIVKLDKGEFIGRDVLARQKHEGPPRKLVGFEMVERGIARHGYPVFVGGQPSEVVTSGTFAPFLKKSIGLAYVPAESAIVGTDLEIEIRGRRAKARVVPTPFYQRDRNRH